MAPQFQSGERLLHDRYEIIQLLGQGGSGVVYEAWHLPSEERVALKLLDSHSKHDERPRFQREIDLISRLKHPNTVRLIDSGFLGDTPFMALEFVEGHPLDVHLALHGPLNFTQARTVFIQILGALEEAHSWGIVHRDLKPANIMLSGTPEEPVARVLDFGIAGVEQGFKSLSGQASITIQGEIRGTPHYMAPEQVTTFAEPRAETDIYATGLILLECLTGKIAVDGNTAQSVLFKHVQGNFEIPSFVTQSPFGPVILRATRVEPDERYPKADAMAADLRRISPDGTSVREHSAETMPTIQGNLADVRAMMADYRAEQALLEEENADNIKDGNLEQILDGPIPEEPQPESSKRMLIVLGGILVLAAAVAIAVL